MIQNMYKSVFFSYIFFLMIITISTAKKIISYQESNESVDVEIKHKSIETTYFTSFLFESNKHDPVCDELNKNAKISLCEKIFNITHYKSFNIFLNKTAVYLQKLSCEEKVLYFQYMIPSITVKTKRRMYSCPGRHYTVRTSFIDDRYYQTFYVSGGPWKNSVTIYYFNIFERDGVMIVYDFIKNIKLTMLSHGATVTAQNVPAELKLNKIMYVSENIEEAEYMYLQAYNYVENDPVCDLEYEKKNSLCNIAYNEFASLEVIFNKAAAFLYNMKCQTRPIYKLSSLENQNELVILSKKQNLYPCYGRHKIPVTQNYLHDDMIKTMHLSNGPKRNSVFVYVVLSSEEMGNIFTLLGLIENINFRTLKPTSITLEDIHWESVRTYNSVKQRIKSIESDYVNVIESVIVRKEVKGVPIVDDAQAADMIEEISLHMFESRNQKKVTEDKENIELDDSSSDVEINETEYLGVGSQIFKILIYKKKRELNTFSKTTDDSDFLPIKLRKELEHKKQKKEDKLISGKQKFHAAVERLINNMVLFVIDKTFPLAEKNKDNFKTTAIDDFDKKGISNKGNVKKTKKKKSTSKKKH